MKFNIILFLIVNLYAYALSDDGEEEEVENIQTGLKGDEGEEDIYTLTSSCPYRFNMGCMLDVLEKACTGIQDVEACLKDGKCEDEFGNLEATMAALRPKSLESIYKCCCTKAYARGYENCEHPNPVCAASVKKYLVDDGMKEHWKILRKCARNKTKENCEKALISLNWLLEAVQKARGEMWPTEGCKLLAPLEPISKCGWDVKPEARAIERADLYCDTIIWQYKEMGASDAFMSQCPHAPKMPVKEEDKEENKEGNEEENEEENEEAGEDAENRSEQVRDEF